MIPHLSPSATHVDSKAVEKARTTSDALRALSHEQRLMILAVLKDGERSVGELEALLKLPQPAVSQQLARLRVDDLVTSRRDGRTIHYAINEAPLLQIFEGLAALLGYRIMPADPQVAPSGAETEGEADAEPEPDYRASRRAG